jgi:hypothetical protein
MQNKDHVASEIDENKEVFFASEELKDILSIIPHEVKSTSMLITDKGTFEAAVLAYRKTKTKTNIKLQIKENIVTQLILCNILKLQIMNAISESIDVDFKETNLIKTSIYLNSSKDTIVKIKFLNESESNNEV